MIPKGTYNAKATKADFGTSKKKQTDYVRVQFQVTDGPEAGQLVSWDGYFTEKTSARTIESLRFCGCTFPNSNITDLAGIDTQTVHIVVEHESFTPEQGENAGVEQVRARVAWVNDPNRGGVPEDQQMGDSAKKAFAAKMKGALLATGRNVAASPNSRSNGGGGSGSMQTKQAGDFEDRDIPFLTSKPNDFGL